MLFIIKYNAIQIIQYKYPNQDYNIELTCIKNLLVYIGTYNNCKQGLKIPLYFNSAVLSNFKKDKEILH